jgi:hypothetical protein
VPCLRLRKHVFTPRLGGDGPRPAGDRHTYVFVSMASGRDGAGRRGRMIDARGVSTITGPLRATVPTRGVRGMGDESRIAFISFSPGIFSFIELAPPLADGSRQVREWPERPAAKGPVSRRLRLQPSEIRDDHRRGEHGFHRQAIEGSPIVDIPVAGKGRAPCLGNTEPTCRGIRPPVWRPGARVLVR